MSTSHPTTVIVLSIALGALSGCQRASSNEDDLVTIGSERQSTLPLTPEAKSKPEEVKPGANEPAQLGLQGNDPQSNAAKSPREQPSGASEYPSGELDPVAVPGRSERAEASAGAPTPSCIKGWTAPGRGSALRKAALDMIRARASERFVVQEIRYFLGPEDAEVVRPHGDVERWYVKAVSLAKQPRRQRWLVRRAAVGRGVDAVAPFDSSGYGPGTWKRLSAPDDSLSDPFQRPCDRAPAGQKCMGLPREVLGCLDGT